MAKLTPREIDFAESAPVQLEGSAVLQATPAELWAVLTDNESWPEWFKLGVTKCTPTSQDGKGLGATREVIVGAAGKGVTFQERFIAWEPEKLWAFTGTAGPGTFVSLVERCTMEPVDELRTSVTYRMAIDPKGVMKPMLPLMRRSVPRALTQGMKSLGAEAIARRS